MRFTPRKCLCAKIVTFPKAIKLLSKKSITPRNKKNPPKPAKPTPISKTERNVLTIVIQFIFNYLLWVSVISNIVFL